MLELTLKIACIRNTYISLKVCVLDLMEIRLGARKLRINSLSLPTLQSK